MLMPVANMRLRVAVAAALAGAIAMPAVVQAAPEPQAATLEEIVVTARKREESLQEVPIAVTAFSSAALEQIGVKSLEDIALRTPGLQFSEQAGQIAGRYNCSIRFRGMNVNSEQAVYQLGALFIDGIYVASGCSGTGSEDLERVEVVKGPQAVYFGRNTFGGAVNYVTKDPGNDWGGKVSASAAEDDDYEYTGSVEGPIIRDKLAFRLTGRYYDRGGIFVSNFGDDLGEQKTQSVALKVVATPTEALTIKMRGYYGEDRDGPSAGGFISGNLNDTCTGTFGPNGEVRRRYICGEIPGIDAAITANNGSLISYNTNLTVNAFMPALPPPTFAPVNLPEYLRTQLLENGANDPAIDDALSLDFYGLKRNTTYVGAIADYEFGNGMTLTGVYGYNRMRANWLRDFDFTDRESWWSTDPQNLEDENYELRLTSSQEGKLTWVFGASYYEMEYTQSGNGGTAVTRIPVGTQGFPSTFRNSLVNNVDQTYTAVFGGATYKFTDQWSLSLEARWQEDELEKGAIIAAQAGLPVTTSKWSDLLPRVILQWQPTPETNLYASYAVGVLPGDINAEFIYGPDNMRTTEQIASVQDQTLNGADPYPELNIPNGTPGIPEATPTLDREKLDSYEIGWKQTWLDGRISTAIAAYYMEWENQKGRLSAAVVDFNGNTTAPFVRDTVDANGAPCGVRSATSLVCNDTLRTIQLQVPGFSELKGVELEGSWFVNDNLTLQAGLEWTDNEYTDFTFNFVELLAGTSDMKGNSSPRYPEWKGNVAANYQAPLGGTGWDWFTRWDYIYFGEYFVDESNLASAPEQNLLNARIGLTNGNMRVELFGNNLTDEDAYAAAGRWSDFSIPGNFNFPANQGVVVTPQRPRYFGLKVSYTF
jgi:iron complex outermembrane receptor protein